MTIEKVQLGMGGYDSEQLAAGINEACKGGRKIIGCVVETPSWSNWPRPFLLVTADPDRFQGESI